jgi:hypothetical protein
MLNMIGYHPVVGCMLRTLETPPVTPLILPPAAICRSSPGCGHSKNLKTYERTGNVNENKQSRS